MTAPKGTSCAPFPIGDGHAVHVYSDAQRIWLQLRRTVPTEQDIGKPSFKVALRLTPEQAIDIATELLTAARRGTPKATAAGKQPPKVKPPAQPPRE